MKRMLVPACLVVAGLIAPRLAAAQDVAITNARVIVGSGQVIESGTIIVRGGKIVSVTAGAAPTQGLRIIDAKGMSAMPGFIDGHKHVNNGENAAAQMRSLLEAGYTTVLAGGGQADANIALRDRIDKGEFVGPRIIASGQVNLRQTPAEARAAVQALAAKGIKHTGEIGLTPEPAPPQSEIEVLKAIVDEAKKAGVQVNVHAVSSPAMVAAIDAGVTRLVHLPNKDFTSYEQAEKVAQTGSIVAGLIAFGAPNIDSLSPAPAQVQWPKDNTARFRDGKPWPEAIAGANRDPKGPRDRHRRRLHDHQCPPHLGCRPEPSDDLVFHRPERRGPRGARARAEVVQHRVLDGRHPQDHRSQRRPVCRHGRSDRDARGGQARRHHPDRRQPDAEYLRDAEDEGRPEGRQGGHRQALAPRPGLKSFRSETTATRCWGM